MLTSRNSKRRASEPRRCAPLSGSDADDVNPHTAQEEIISASFAVGQYLRSQGYEGKVYVVGHSGICEELAEAGYEWLGEAHT